MKRKQFLKITAAALAGGGTSHLAVLADSPMCRQTYNVKDFGAKGDGLTLDTQAIQQAVDRCTVNKGSLVSIPSGRYLIGTLTLKSDVTLRLEDDAVLLGSHDLADYRTDIIGAIEAPAFNRCLIYAHSANNIKIEGNGCIDGRGDKEAFPVKIGNALGERPMLIRFVGCQRLSFRNVTLKDCASWCCHLVNCEKVFIDRVTIDSHVNVNNDGFDLDGCKSVKIQNCQLRTGDDAICPKSTTERYCEGITVSHCRISSGTAAIKCGTSSRGGFRDITIEHCEFHDCKMGAIKLLMVDGGVLENVTISDIVMTRVEGPLFIRLGNRGRNYELPTEQTYDVDADPEGLSVGKLRNVTIKNIRAEVTGDDKARQGLMITGIPGHNIEGVTLENIDISFSGNGTSADAGRSVPEDIARYPEQFFFGVLPAWGLYARHVDGLTLRDVALTTRMPDERPSVIFEDIHGMHWFN